MGFIRFAIPEIRNETFIEFLREIVNVYFLYCDLTIFLSIFTSNELSVKSLRFTFLLQLIGFQIGFSGKLKLVNFVYVFDIVT